MIKLPNGDILCAMAHGLLFAPVAGAVARRRSDLGTRPESMGWPGAKPQLQVLPNGVLVCASGRGSYGHPQVTHVMISIDGTGEQLGSAVRLPHRPGMLLHLDHAAATASCMWFYSDSDFTRDMGTHGLPVQRIRRAVIDISISA